MSGIDSTNPNVTLTREQALQMACATWEARESVWLKERETLKAELELLKAQHEIMESACVKALNEKDSLRSRVEALEKVVEAARGISPDTTSCGRCMVISDALAALEGKE